MKRKETLAKFLNIDINDIEISEYNNNIFIVDNNKEYLVLTDEEANEETKSYISESLWAFSIDFLQQFMEDAIAEEAETIIKALQEKCESGNDAIKTLVNWKNNQDDIVETAISWDGRGHFLSSYDGEENEEEEYYIYRIN